jgi:hypothetical protein
VEPRNGIERSICRVFEELLHVGTVGIDDNFFELGGHSLLAVSLQQRLHRTLEREARVVDVFDCPTPRELARRLMPAAAAPRLSLSGKPFAQAEAD